MKTHLTIKNNSNFTYQKTLEKHMFAVGIKDWRIAAFVGLYPEEKLIPNVLNISISVQHKTEKPWVDYTLLVTWTKEILQTPHDLLEDVLYKIRDKIKSEFPQAQLEITIEKLNPPTGEQIVASFVRWIE